VPEIRKLVDLRTTKAVCLPTKWLKYYENLLGQEINYVALEIDRKLQIEPYIPPKQNRRRKSM